MASLLDFLMGNQPSAPQSIASALPFYNLPKKQMAFFQPAFNMSAAAIDPSSPEYQRLYGQKRQQGQQNLAEVIAEAQRQNRKASLLGRTPLFSNERGGEEIFRNLNRGYQDVQNQAATDTEQLLGKRADSLYKQGAVGAQYAANKAGIHGNLLGAITKLFGL